MHFLLVNDDGYTAEGIRALAKAALEAGHRVTLCAPDRERSSAGHSFTAADVLRAKRFADGDIQGWAVNGTPADCARLGAYLLRDDAPDMVLAGINHGANMGGACVYSGTVGAAMEASMAGLPAVATSLCGVSERGFALTAKLSVRFAEWAAKHPLARGALYNFNVPDIAEGEIRGIRRASLAPLFLGEAAYVEGVNPIGVHYYWLADGENVPMTDPKSDVLLSAAGYVTVTPLTWDMASSAGMDELPSAFISQEPEQ